MQATLKTLWRVSVLTCEQPGISVSAGLKQSFVRGTDAKRGAAEPNDCPNLDGQPRPRRRGVVVVARG